MKTDTLLWGCVDGLRGTELAMTLEQARSCSHQGQCDEDCKALASEPEIAKQLDAIGPDKLRVAVKESGADCDGDGESTPDRDRIYCVWFAACDIAENNREDGQ